MALYLLKPSEMATAWLFGGLPRSGKSYHAAAIARRWLRAGGHVVSNMQLNIPSGFAGRAYRGQYKRLESGRNFTVDVQAFREVVDGHILLILDEAASIFDSRDFKNFPPDVRALLAQHAKMRISIITICHGYDMVDASFRKLAGYYVHHVSVGRSPGCAGLLVSLFVPGLMFRYTQALAGGELVGKRTETKFYFGRRKVWEFYDTFQIAEGSFRGSDTLKKAVVTGYGWRRSVLFVGTIWAAMRFTPLNAPVSAELEVDQSAVFETVAGEVCQVDVKTAAVDLVTSSSDIVRIYPDYDFVQRYGREPLDWSGKYVSVDVFTSGTQNKLTNTNRRVIDSEVAEE